MALDVNTFDQLRIGLARRFHPCWSNAKSRSPRRSTTHPASREGRPVLREDLRPTKDWECYCGKYKRCASRASSASAAASRSPVQGAPRPHGHIELAAPSSTSGTCVGPVVAAYLLMGTEPVRSSRPSSSRSHLLCGEPGHLGRRGEAPADLPSLENEMAEEIADI